MRACSELPKLCAFFHIPFQSGDNDILREMKRGYTHERCVRACVHACRGEGEVGGTQQGHGKICLEALRNITFHGRNEKSHRVLQQHAWPLQGGGQSVEWGGKVERGDGR